MVCLKGIPRNLSPDLLQTLAQMGHGDEIVLADANFPTASICRNGPRELREDGVNIPDLLTSVLKLLPLDTYDLPAVILMDLEPQDRLRNLATPIWKVYDSIMLMETAKSDATEHDKDCTLKMIRGTLPRFEFYERAKKAFAVVHTGEKALYGNIILRKGVIP